MDHGQIGRNTLHAVSHAVMECLFEQERVPILPLPMVEDHAMVKQGRKRNVICVLVQVNIYFS